MKIKIAAVVTAVLLALGAVGCSEYNDARGRGDAPVLNKTGDNSPKAVTNNPDGFANIVTGCVNGAPGFRYVTTTHGKSAAPGLAVFPDSKC